MSILRLDRIAFFSDALLEVYTENGKGIKCIRRVQGWESFVGEGNINQDVKRVKSLKKLIPLASL